MAYGIWIADHQGWLSFYDPDYTVDGNPHTGLVDITADPAKAMRFETAIDAGECWRQQSTTRPLRPDGKPNRPLTAFTVEIKPLE